MCVGGGTSDNDRNFEIHPDFSAESRPKSGRVLASH